MYNKYLKEFQGKSVYQSIKTYYSNHAILDREYQAIYGLTDWRYD